jgi:uncharacterized protein
MGIIDMNVFSDATPQLIQPLMPPEPQKRVWGAWPTFGFSLVILCVFFVAQGIVIVIPTLGSLFSHIAAGVSSADELTNLILDEINSKLGLYQSIATIVSGVAGAGLILIFIKARKGLNIAEYLGLNKISFKSVLASVGIVIGVMVVVNLALYLVGAQNTETIIDDIYNTAVWPPLFWVAVVIFAPLFEEALFRGFLFEGLRRSWWGVYGAISLTSFGWALLHGFQYSVGGIAYIFLLGIAIGIVRWKTNSIWNAFIMHAVVNLIATISLAANWNF